jgi:hypothetical protein
MAKVAILLLLVSTSFGTATAVAQEVPRFDISRTCRAEEPLAQDKAAVDSCMADEERSREQLTRQWGQSPADIRRSCLSDATDASGIRSYVELLTCIQIAQDASKLTND